MDSAIWTTISVSTFGIICSGFIGFLASRYAKHLDNQREDKKTISLSDLEYRRQFGSDYSQLVRDLSESLQASQEDLRDLRLEFRTLRSESEMTHLQDMQKIETLQRDNREQAARIYNLEKRIAGIDSVINGNQG